MTLNEQQLDNDVRRIREQHWPVCLEILHDAVDKMHDELEKTITDDEAYSMINLLLLREIFWRRAILVAAGQDDDGIVNWIEQEYIAWEEEA